MKNNQTTKFNIDYVKIYHTCITLFVKIVYNEDISNAHMYAIKIDKLIEPLLQGINQLMIWLIYIVKSNCGVARESR